MTKTPTMQAMYGTRIGHICKDCIHLRTWSFGKRKVYKCELWLKHFTGNSSASDIRLKNVACGKFDLSEEAQKKIDCETSFEKFFTDLKH